MSVIAMTVFFRTEMKHGQLQDGVKFYGALFYSLINVMFNGMAELALTLFRLPVFFKQRDFLFYPAWAFALPIWVLRIPLSLMESGIWIILTYYTIGFAPSASRFFRQLLHSLACIRWLYLSSASLQHLEEHRLWPTLLVPLHCYWFLFWVVSL
ncbi:Pleiotropic drug resistance protein 2 [Vitis vinifera]|uniref:Pleiotropic drug resistance protein 2 n=1 Tax=Vitis vinifera TaxID=29760 RepID=A0A438DFD9_VITVI|nr:Pleiotropic drug resistance protein 2 [Vitis vinifera]